jgi:hypothetical protein
MILGVSSEKTKDLTRTIYYDSDKDVFFFAKRIKMKQDSIIAGLIVFAIIWPAIIVFIMKYSMYGYTYSNYAISDSYLEDIILILSALIISGIPFFKGMLMISKQVDIFEEFEEINDIKSIIKRKDQFLDEFKLLAIFFIFIVGLFIFMCFDSIVNHSISAQLLIVSAFYILFFLGLIIYKKFIFVHNFYRGKFKHLQKIWDEPDTVEADQIENHEESVANE